MPTAIRGASILLMVVGAVTVLFTVPVMLDAATARCRIARNTVEQANTDRNDWNDVDTGGKKARDLPCDDAAHLVGQIRQKENSDKFKQLPSESTLANRSAVAAVMGVVQAVSGFSVIRRRSRLARNAAIGASTVGLFLPVLGPLSFGVYAFVVYAFAFSAASREVWPKEDRSHD
jgi:hypothetical protein